MHLRLIFPDEQHTGTGKNIWTGNIYFLMACPGWAPDPPMVGIRSPIGLVVGSCTSHPGVLGSIPKREEPGKTGAPCVKVQGSSRVPSLVRDEQTHPHRPRLVVSHSTVISLNRFMGPVDDSVTTNTKSQSHKIAHVLHSPPLPPRTAL